jgi:hypothetical protein
MVALPTHKGTIQHGVGVKKLCTHIVHTYDYFIHYFYGRKTLMSSKIWWMEYGMTKNDVENRPIFGAKYSKNNHDFQAQISQRGY